MQQHTNPQDNNSMPASKSLWKSIRREWPGESCRTHIVASFGLLRHELLPSRGLDGQAIQVQAQHIVDQRLVRPGVLQSLQAERGAGDEGSGSRVCHRLRRLRKATLAVLAAPWYEGTAAGQRHCTARGAESFQISKCPARTEAVMVHSHQAVCMGVSA